jgi:serine/threonine protein kinase
MLETDDKIGDYTLVKFLGKGQFGEVWLAEKQLQFSRRRFSHALKFLSNRTEGLDIKAVEAEIDTWIEASGHPNVMPVLDMLTFRDYVVIASEYADGGSLKGWLVKNGQKAPTVEKGLEMLVGILRGIEHLHSKNIVHRDLKPDNILLQGNFPRITDFGISRIVSADSMSTKAMGSPAYMSPESFKGIKSPQNDIWSAGVILYEMMTGNYPFYADNIYGLINAIQTEEMKPIVEYIHPEIRIVLEKTLQKDHERRYQTASEMRKAIEQVVFELKSETLTDITAELPTNISESKLEIKAEEPQSTAPVFEVSSNEPSIFTKMPTELLDGEASVVKTQPHFESLNATVFSMTESTRNSDHSEEAKEQNFLDDFINPIEIKRNEQRSIRKRNRFLVGSAIGSGAIVVILAGLMANQLFSPSQTATLRIPNPSVSNTFQVKPKLRIRKNKRILEHF